MKDALVRPGDIWKDVDPRGGPTFRVVSVDPPHLMPGRATVEGLNGKNRRTVLLARFRHHANYRTGYTLVCREPGTEETDT